MMRYVFVAIAAFSCAVNVLCFVGKELYEKRRNLVKAPSGLKIENSWIAQVEGTKKDCARVKKKIDQLKKKSNQIGVTAAGDSTQVSIARLCLVEFTGDETLAQTILDTIDDVVKIEQDMVVHAESPPESWGLDRIDQEDLPLSNSPFLGSYTGAGVTVYVVDTGINKVHNDFGNRASYGGDFINENKKEDLNGHGTHCAGTVGGKKYGVAKDANLVGVKVLSAGGSGSYSGVIQGIQWAVDDADGTPGVISMSLGGGKHNLVEDAVKAASEAGMIVVVAAGNENQDACNVSPAGAGGNGDEGGVITVASTTSSDSRSGFSNWGKCTDVFAPGSQIKSAWIGSKTATNTISGTSMATPHVAGVAAILLEKHNFNRDATVDDLFSLMVLNKVSDKKNKSPNLLLQVPVSTFPPTPPTVAPTLPPSFAPPQICADNADGNKACYDFESSTFGAEMPTEQIIYAPLKFADTLLCDQVNEDYTNSIVLVSRGECLFYDKVKHAYKQGALAVIIHMANDDPIFPPAYYEKDTLTIPSVMISLKDANSIKKAGEETMAYFGGGNIGPTPQPTPPTPKPSASPTVTPDCSDLTKKKHCRSYDHCRWLRRGRTCVENVAPPPSVSAPTPSQDFVPCSYGSLKEAENYCSEGGSLCTYQELVAKKDYGAICDFIERKYVWTSTKCSTKKGKEGNIVYRKTNKLNGRASCAQRKIQKRFHLCCVP